ncbi:MAG: hypothetical protein EOM72_02005 [Opitutae bacterium]|nr:hypothetical protein [Opitutae bacterium]
MSNDRKQATEMTEIREGDILFDCPYCGKNMAIESAGSGLMVPCANCGRAVQVPIPDAGTPEAPVAAVPRPAAGGEEDPQAVIRQLDAALSMANEQIDRLAAEKEALQERRSFLEQVRSSNAERLDRIAAELASVQDALDRAVALLAEARSEKPV